jgi:hypothetical protein
MTQIICRVTACVFWEQGVCSAEQIEYELDDGCLTFQDMGDLELEGEDDDLDWEDDEDAGLFDDDDDAWDDDDEGWDEDLGP